MKSTVGDVIKRAIESGNAVDAQVAIREIDSRLTFTEQPAERAALPLNKAVFLGILGRFADATAQLELARQEAPDDEVT